MLNGSSVYLPLQYTSGYHHITVSPEAQKKSSFNKKVPFSLAQVPMHFQYLINKVVKGLPFSFGYLNYILIFSKTV